jgi:hypothetical protein
MAISAAITNWDETTNLCFRLLTNNDR